MGSALTGMTYIFDEPSTGMHPRDVHRMTKLLKNLRDKWNTILVVEHDKDVISIADVCLYAKKNGIKSSLQRIADKGGKKCFVK